MGLMFDLRALFKAGYRGERIMDSSVRCWKKGAFPELSKRIIGVVSETDGLLALHDTPGNGLIRWPKISLQESA